MHKVVFTIKKQELTKFKIKQKELFKNTYCNANNKKITKNNNKK